MGTGIAHEIELKLHAEPGDLSVLRERAAAAGYPIGPPVTRRLVTTYYDTPDRRLAACGLALRVRRVGRRHVQTVKSRARAANGESAGAAYRREWEWPIASGKPDLAVLGEVGVAGLLDARDLAAIAPIFRTEIERTRFELDGGGGALVELALDRGTVVVGDARRAISEIELELLSHGPESRPGRLYAIALALHGIVPLRIGTESKADIGYGMLGAARLSSCKATAVALDAAAGTAAAFQVIARSCIGHLLDNQACVLAGSKARAVGGIHQMRVALRRLRAGFSLFAPHLDPDGLAPLKDGLRWLAGELSPARDWDVFVKETVKRALGQDAKAAQSVRRHAGPRRAEARQRAVEALRAPRYTTLVLTLGRWLEEEVGAAAPHGASAPALPVSEVAPVLLERRARKVAKAGRHIEMLSVDKRHRLRKSLKSLRYGAAFFEGLYPGDDTKSYLTALARLQDALGELNDLAVARGLAAVLGGGADHRLAGGLARIERHINGREQALVAALPAAWRRFRKVQPFWR